MKKLALVLAAILVINKIKTSANTDQSNTDVLNKSK